MLALLLLAWQWDQQQGLGLVGHAREGAFKLAQSLPTESRARVLATAQSFHERVGLSGLTEARNKVQTLLVSALSRQRQLRLTYRNPSTLEYETSKFCVYRLFLHEGHWCFVGRSSLHRRVEALAVDAIRHVIVTEDPAVVPPRFNLERFLGQAWGLERQSIRHQVWLRFSRKAATGIEGKIWHRTQKTIALADGRIDFHVSVDGIDAMVRWILGFGDEVEVLAPQELRRQLHDIARKVAERHAPPINDAGCGAPAESA